MEKILEPRLTEMTDRSFCPIFFAFDLKGDIEGTVVIREEEPGALNKGTFQEDGFSAPSVEQQGAGEELRLRGRVGSGRRRRGTNQTLALVLGAQSHGQEGSERQKGKTRGDRKGCQCFASENKKNVTNTLEKLKNHTRAGG